jgi:hypothetical protein
MSEGKRKVTAEAIVTICARVSRDAIPDLLAEVKELTLALNRQGKRHEWYVQGVVIATATIKENDVHSPYTP